MVIITLPGLRLGQLQTIGENSIDICKDIKQLAPEMVKVNSSFDAFKTGMLKDKTSAEEKRKLDLAREQLVSGFINVVYEEQKFPNDDQKIVNAHAELLTIVKKYGHRIIRLPLAEETAAIDNLLADIAQMDVKPLLQTGIPCWIPAIEAANEDYKQAAKEFISDRTDAGFIESASSLTPALEEALEDLYTMLFATIKRTPNDALKKAYGDLETLIDSMR